MNFFVIFLLVVRFNVNTLCYHLPILPISLNSEKIFALMNSLVTIVKRFPFREKVTSNLSFHTLKLSVVTAVQVHDEVLLGLLLYILQFWSLV